MTRGWAGSKPWTRCSGYLPLFQVGRLLIPQPWQVGAWRQPPIRHGIVGWGLRVGSRMPVPGSRLRFSDEEAS
jgi:hypothetical protein